MSNVFVCLGRAELAMKEREREDRIRRIKEQQEEDRRKKLVELKQHVSLTLKWSRGFKVQASLGEPQKKFKKNFF